MSTLKSIIKNGLILGEKIAPSLNHKLAFRLFLKPIGHVRQVPAAYQPIWDKKTNVLLPFNLGNVATYHWQPDEPNGETIVLTHGWAANATTMLGFIDPLLQQGFRVIAWDAPAHGQSSGKRTTLPEWIATLKQITAANPTTTGHIAHSFGGMVVTNVIGRNYNPTQGIQRFVTLGTPATIKEILTQFSITLGGLPRSLLNGISDQIEHIAGHPAVEFDASHAMMGNAMPALIIHDEKDRRVPYNNAKQIADVLVNGETVTTSGLGHRRILRDEAIIERVVAFFPSKVKVVDF